MTASTDDLREIFTNLTKELMSVGMKKAASDIEMNTMLFGRILDKKNKDKPQLSVFEQVLKTKGSSTLINLIWNKLGLATHREIIDLVSFD